MNIISKHCNLCDNELKSLNDGLTCGLTNKQPEFNKSCSKISLTEKFQQELEIVNLDIEITKRTKKSFSFKFYSSILIGLISILLVYPSIDLFSETLYGI